MQAEEKVENLAPDETDAVQAETEETSSGEVLIDSFETTKTFTAAVVVSVPMIFLSTML